MTPPFDPTHGTTDDQPVEGNWHHEPARFRSDRLIIAVRWGYSMSSVLAGIRQVTANKLEELEFFRRRGHRWAIMQFTPLQDAAQQIPQLAALIATQPGVGWAEPDFAGKGHLDPNDPRYPGQSWPQQIEINKLWDATVGDGNVVLAVLDSGICVQGWTKPQHVDLDSSRFITRHTQGTQFFSHNYVWSLPYIMAFPRDGHGHGTHVAGIAGAITNNNVGIAGANWRSKVYIARVLNDDNVGYVSDLLLAVADLLRYVAAGSPWPALLSWLIPRRLRKRVVINLSLGFQTSSAALAYMCKVTDNGRVMFCVAAGSRGASMTQIDYPAALAAHFNHVIAVGSVNSKDVINLPILSDYAAITLFAPGVDILSTRPGYPTTLYAAAAPDSYETETGTSQACPIVAGAVSLLWSRHAGLRPFEIRRGLVKIAAKVTDAAGKNYPRIHLRNHAEIKPSPWPWPWW